MDASAAFDWEGPRIGSLVAMSFNPRAIRGASPGLPGEIDYRLARQSVISEYRKGRVAQHEVCDAHPELIRAARNVGEESSRTCPICEEANVVLVYLDGRPTWLRRVNDADLFAEVLDHVRARLDDAGAPLPPALRARLFRWTGGGDGPAPPIE